MPDSEKFTPAEIWSRRLLQRDTTSPLQLAAPLRCWPANAERVRMNTRWSGYDLRLPWYTAVVVISGYELKNAAPGPCAVGPMRSLRSSILMLDWMSGSVASIHHASMPSLPRLSLIWRQ